MLCRRAALFSCLLPLTFLACGDTAEPGGDPAASDEAEILPVAPGKSDDYFSTAGREYTVLGEDLFVLDAPLPEGDALQETLEQTAQLRQNALAFFLHAYVASKSSHDTNAEYGGFRTTVRQKTIERLSPEPVEDGEEPSRTFSYLFEIEVAGPNDLLRNLPLDSDGAFALTLPLLSAAELRSGSYSRTYSNFDPSKLEPAQLTQISLHIQAEEGEPDAYPEYQALFDDDLLDVLLLVGGDYNDARYDMQAARGIFGLLQSELKLQAPVATFEELRSDSGPFVGALDAGDRSVRFEVTLIHPDMQAEPELGYEGLKELFRRGMAGKDVIIYDGHAGYDESYSGVVVHYNPRHAVPAVDFADLDMPEKYQIVFFNGCKTYTQYADNLYRNPAKTEGNLDILTTVNFSWLSEMGRVTTAFLKGLTQREAGQHKPLSYGEVLAEMNRGTSWDVIYGVHGVAGNPHMSPYGEVDSLCRSCTRNSDCPGAGNLCLALAAGGGRVCGVACTDDSGCPADYACREVSRGRSIIGKQCLPRGNACP